MIENEGGPGGGESDVEPIGADRDGGAPAVGGEQPQRRDAPEADDEAPIDLDSVQDRAS